MITFYLQVKLVDAIEKGVMSREETCQHKVIVMFVNRVYLYSWITAAIHTVTGLRTCIIENVIIGYINIYYTCT